MDRKRNEAEATVGGHRSLHRPRHFGHALRRATIFRLCITRETASSAWPQFSSQFFRDGLRRTLQIRDHPLQILPFRKPEFGHGSTDRSNCRLSTSKDRFLLFHDLDCGDGLSFNSAELHQLSRWHKLPGKPTERPALLDDSWVKHGIDEERKSGLVRALFCVRLLELEARTTPYERLSYLVGCFISQTLSALSSKSLIREHAVICGAAGISRAWKIALSEYGVEAEDYAEQTEHAFIRGLRELSFVTPEVVSVEGGS